MKLPERIWRLLLPVLLLCLLVFPVNASCSHEYIEIRVEPTCTEGGVYWLECIHCGHTKEYKLIESPGHTFTESYTLEEPTCTREGLAAHDCMVCGFHETLPIPRLDHDFVAEVKAPTCTAGGYTRNNCRTCDAYYISDYTEPLGHRYDHGVITKEPTRTAMGRMRYTCSGCNDTYENMIPTLSNPFEDIPWDVFYTTPVLWAATVGITRGIDETHFAPDQPCTRAQVVTFLWRRAGKPTPQSRENPFTDVPAGSFFEQAVLWAYETGITTGTDSTLFSPELICNRAQVVTFLHRFRGCPEPFRNGAFADVPEGSFFHKAVLWAAQTEITLGMDNGLFCPELTCNRAQIVTFLYRDAKIP